MYKPGASLSSTIEETTENLLKAAERSLSLVALNDAETSRHPDEMKKTQEEMGVANPSSLLTGMLGSDQTNNGDIDND
ncbi:hypothetical protein PsorP6_013025 [Peronosclerospora sorghi]|uniref:Uncharacterized protein n=1 Tax=Peronosclerospora sorghi TaxID=230839 RepID=A0ACC0WHW0_9STRA|nr:hypothetical protein PsorP6_013025 [Peronosclerospora sorghi]